MDEKELKSLIIKDYRNAEGPSDFGEAAYIVGSKLTKDEVDYVPEGTKFIIKAYISDPKATNPLTSFLKRSFPGMEPIAYEPLTVDFIQEATVEAILRILDGEILRDGLYYGKDRKYALLCTPGVIPGKAKDEDPLIGGEPLGPDGFSEITNISWSTLENGVPLATRQFVRMLVEKNKINPSDETHLGYIREWIEAGNMGDRLKERYQSYIAEFQRQQQLFTSHYEIGLNPRSEYRNLVLLKYPISSSVAVSIS